MSFQKNLDVSVLWRRLLMMIKWVSLTKASIQNDPLDHYFVFSVGFLTFRKVPNLTQ